MPSEKSISFRANLLSSTTDLLGEVDLHCVRTARLIVGIVSQLAAYTEEGRPLHPSVFICNSITDLVRRAGAGEYIRLSGDEQTETAAPKTLKAAAPLCTENWRIYVQRSANGEQCQFGIFCGSNDPAALTVDEVVLSTFDPEFPIIKIAQTATNKVEVRTSGESAIEFRFNDDLDVADLRNRERISQLAKLIASGVQPEAPQFAEFVERILTMAVRQSHGTLIAVIASGTVLPDALTGC